MHWPVGLVPTFHRLHFQTLVVALEPMLDDNTTLARAAETRIVLRELQDDLTSCWFLCLYSVFPSYPRYAAQQVTDILRNKLHHQASQLADSFNRVKELEQEKRGSLRELLLAREDEKRHFELLITVGQFYFCFQSEQFNYDRTR